MTVQTWYAERFPTRADVLARLGAPRPSDSGRDSVGDAPSKHWDLEAGFEGALGMYRGGWAEGAAKCWELSERIRVQSPGTRKRTPTRAMVGGAVHVPSYLAGQPRHMITLAPRDAQSPRYLTLYIPVGYLGKVDASCAFDRGVAFVALVDALEDAGVRVRVIAYRSSQMKASDARVSPLGYLMTFNVKEYSEPLDPDSLIFTVAHPAMFRRLGFGLQERSDDATVRKSTRHGYGISLTPPLEKVQVDDDPGVLFQVLNPQDIQSPEGYLEDLISTLPDEYRAVLED